MKKFLNASLTATMIKNKFKNVKILDMMSMKNVMRKEELSRLKKPLQNKIEMS